MLESLQEVTPFLCLQVVRPADVDDQPGQQPLLVPIATLHGFDRGSAPLQKSLNAKNKRKALSGARRGRGGRVANSTRRLAAAEADAAEALLQGGVFNSGHASSTGGEGDDIGEVDDDAEDGTYDDGGRLHSQQGGLGAGFSGSAFVNDDDNDYGELHPSRSMVSMRELMPPPSNVAFPNLQQLYGQEGYHAPATWSNSSSAGIYASHGIAHTPQLGSSTGDIELHSVNVGPGILSGPPTAPPNISGSRNRSFSVNFEL